MNEKTMVSDALVVWRDDSADREQRVKTMPETDSKRM